MYGLGAIQSPPDARDLSVDVALELVKADVSSAPPTTYNVAKMPPIYDQGTSPMCVAFGSSTLKDAEDLAELGHNYLWDRNYFFRRIGGTINGAQPRVALEQMLKVGYPLLPANSGNSQAVHKIAAYYAVPKTKLAIQQAIQALGAIGISTPWYNSWFTPNTDGTLPPPDFEVGGHYIVASGWDPRGLKLQQSWGTSYGLDGIIYMPWAFVLHAVWECWKCVDAIATPK